MTTQQTSDQSLGPKIGSGAALYLLLLILLVLLIGLPDEAQVMLSQLSA